MVWEGGAERLLPIPILLQAKPPRLYRACIPAFFAMSAYFFWQMPDDAGNEISGRKAREISSRKGAAQAAAKAATETTEDTRDQRLG